MRSFCRNSLFLVVLWSFVLAFITDSQFLPKVEKRVLDADTQVAINARRISSLQPKVSVILKNPATKLLGSLSMPTGSPWCSTGQRMVWLVGHKLGDAPWCENAEGVWAQSSKAIFDDNDVLNTGDGDPVIDRHDCVALKVNNDDRLDIVCSVGANMGKGQGFNELYTTKHNGSLKKILYRHGLHKYPTMRNRGVITLNGIQGKEFVFFSTKGRRPAVARNRHRMFLKIFQN